MTTALLTHAELQWRHDLGDAIRAVRWSPGGRLLALAAGGRVLVDHPSQITRPICGNPRDATWWNDHRLVVRDDRSAFVVGGGVTTVPVGDIVAASVRGPNLVVATDEQLVVWHERCDVPATIAHPTCGRIRALAPLTASLWAVVGAAGAVLVDIRLDTVDGRVDLPGAVSVRPDPRGRIVAVGELAGSVTLWTVGRDDSTQRLDGYPDRVRHLAWGGRAQFLVAAADDELTWWPVDEIGRALDEPARGVGHDSPITALAVGTHSLTCSGDATGRLCLWAPGVTEEPVWTAGLGGEISALAWSPLGDRICAGTVDGDVATWRAHPGLVA